MLRPFEKPHGRLLNGLQFRARREISMNGFFAAIFKIIPLVLELSTDFK
jgi:hypothetical protein